MFTRRLASLLVVCIVISANFAVARDLPVVREQKTVIVDGKTETWRLEWQAKPIHVCGADDSTSLTCPCSGFAYGEQGKLTLVRNRVAGEVERLDLSFLFPKNSPVMGAGGGQAVLQRWAPVVEGAGNDLDKVGDDLFASQMKRRASVDVMKFADFNHDGQATEFLFQVESLPCGKHQMVLVGISKADPHLHIFSSAEVPNVPLILGDWEWEALRASTSPVDVIDWHCMDHGSDQESHVQLSADGGVIHATRTSRQCEIFKTTKPQ